MHIMVIKGQKGLRGYNKRIGLGSLFSFVSAPNQKLMSWPWLSELAKVQAAYLSQQGHVFQEWACSISTPPPHQSSPQVQNNLWFEFR